LVGLTYNIASSRDGHVMIYHYSITAEKRLQSLNNKKYFNTDNYTAVFSRLKIMMEYFRFKFVLGGS